MLDTGASIIFGPNGSGKSFLALSTAITLASGHGMNGVEAPEQPGPTLYLDAEDGAGTWDWRGRCLSQAAGISWDSSLALSRHQTSQLLPDLETRLMALIEEEGIKYIVADSLSRLMSDALNQETINATFGAAARLGVPVLFVSHAPKAAPGQLYGGRAIEGDARYVLNIQLPDEAKGLEKQCWKPTKANSVARPPDRIARWTIDAEEGRIWADVEDGGDCEEKEESADVRIMDLLSDGREVSRADLERELSLPKPTITSALTKLGKAKSVVITRKSGKCPFYGDATIHQELV